MIRLASVFTRAFTLRRTKFKYTFMLLVINITIFSFSSLIRCMSPSSAKGLTTLRLTHANIGIPIVFPFYSLYISKITLSSLDVRGLANYDKRRELFYWFQKKSVSIYILQDKLSLLRTELTSTRSRSVGACNSHTKPMSRHF